MGLILRVVLVVLAASIPIGALAQTGTISGVVRDGSGAVIPGALVEATSPALIEKVRATTSDEAGRYRLPALPVGAYRVSVSLMGFNAYVREDIVLSTDFAATVDAELMVGTVSEQVVVRGETPIVDTQNARQRTVFTGDDIKDLPTSRNLSSIMTLVPGLTFQTGALNAPGGVCVGGAGVWCSPNVNSFNAHASALDADGLGQGRLLVDGMVLNTASNVVTGIGGGYIADVTNVQEVSFNLSGGLGESETGGASINVIPRTGGNRFAGSFTTTYTRKAWFATNTGTHPASSAQPNLILHDNDITVSQGGPIRRDRLWFYSVGRTQGKESSQTGGPLYYNLNAGKWGANYQPDRTRPEVTYTNLWRNVNTRLTYQPTVKHKVNVFWDEQDSCQDPCDGTVASYWSPESTWSVHTLPNRLAQASWTNPRTNRWLLEGGVNVAMQHYNFTKHRYTDNPQDIPRILENGVTAGGDGVASRVNSRAGDPGLSLQSGSIYSSNLSNLDNYRTRLSSSYVARGHNTKVGWEGQFYSQVQNTTVNGPRMSFTYTTPAATCYNAGNPAASTCGNTSLYFPQDPFNQARRPVPTSVEINAGPRTIDEQVWTHSVYAQDQWSLRRVTINGALRYDLARSSYGETCLGPDRFVRAPHCTPAADGVTFHNVSPRWSVAWNVFGDGKTAIKWNMGKYLAAAGFNDVYNGANPARRTLNTLARTWDDTNGNRIPDCDFGNRLAHTSLGDTCGEVTNQQNFRRFGTDPFVLDDTGDAIGLATTHCGRTERGIPQAVRDYCARSDQNLLSGWDKRRSEWQLGLGVQRELFRGVSAEVTYNERWYQNQLITDTLGVGCDLYASNTEQCLNDLAGLRSPQYGFFSVRAPVDPRLPNGGGYSINGLSDRNTAGDLTGPQAITRQPYTYGWRGIDTNFVYRTRGGFRVNGGTSTGKSFRDTCDFVVDAPQQRMRDGGRAPACAPWRPWQTNIRASASYTIPWVDVLASAVFQSRPGVERSANLQFSYRDAVWAPGSEWRASNTTGCPTTGGNAAPVGCLYGQLGGTNFPTINLLDTSDLYGERITLTDLKLAKVFRFTNRRLNVGVDVYNLFNSDAIAAYNNTYIVDNPATPEVEANPWGTAQTLLSPRFARLSIQLDF